MPKIAVLYLQGNKFIKGMKNYRKVFIYTLEKLRYLVIKLLFYLSNNRMITLFLRMKEDIVRHFKEEDLKRKDQKGKSIKKNRQKNKDKIMRNLK